MQISILLLKQIVQLFLMILMGLHYGKDQIFKRRRQQSDLKDHTLSDRTICDHHRISGRLYPKHYERTGSCMYCICDPAVFNYCLSHGSWEKCFI